MNIPPSFHDPCTPESFRPEMPLLTAAAARGRPDYRWHQHVRDLEWLASLSDRAQMLGRGPYCATPNPIIEFEVAQ